MIPMLILLIVKKLKKASFLSKRLLILKRLAVKLGILVFCFLFFSNTNAKNPNPRHEIVYKVVRNDDVIGTIRLERLIEKDSMVLKLESNIEAKFILKFDITGEETSIFKNGILVYSSVYRQVNNKVKSDHEILFDKYNYISKSKNGTSSLPLESIRANLLTLYFQEPLGITEVFCDNEKRMVAIERLSKGVYKVTFSDGKYNVFHYKNGSCIRIEANSKIFNVQLILA